MVTTPERRFLTTVGALSAALAVALVALAVVNALSARLLHKLPAPRWSWDFSYGSVTSGRLFLDDCSACATNTTRVVTSAAPSAIVVAVLLLGFMGAFAAAIVALIAFRARAGFSRRLSTMTWIVAGISLASAVTVGILTEGALGRGVGDRITIFAEPAWGLVALVVVAALAACVAGVLYGFGARLQRDAEGLV